MSDFFFLKRGILKLPLFQKPASNPTFCVLLWLSAKGKNLTLHFDDLTSGTNLHARRVKSALKKLSDNGHITITGSGPIRQIEVTSPWVKTEGEWVSFSAEFGATKGAAKWRVAQIPSKLRKAVMLRDGERCVYCGNCSGPFHIDHIIPVAKGGTDVLSNLCVSCRACNLSKGARTPEEMGWVQ